MRLLSLNVTFLGLLLVMTACEELKGPSTSYGLCTARLKDCQPGYIPSCDSFGPGETPAVVFGNFNGLTITVRVYNLNNGAIAWNNTAYIPQDSTTNWWSLKALPTGMYKAELLTGNTLRQSYKFNVDAGPAKKR